MAVDLVGALCITDPTPADLIGLAGDIGTVHRRTVIVPAPVFGVAVGIGVTDLMTDASITGLAGKTVDALAQVVDAGVFLTTVDGFVAVPVLLARRVADADITGLVVATLDALAVQRDALTLVAAVLVVAGCLFVTGIVADPAVTGLAVGTVDCLTGIDAGIFDAAILIVAVDIGAAAFVANPAIANLVVITIGLVDAAGRGSRIYIDVRTELGVRAGVDIDIDIDIGIPLFARF